MGMKRTLNEHFMRNRRTKEEWFDRITFDVLILPELQHRGDPEFVKDGPVWAARLWAAGDIRNVKAVGKTLYEAAARLLAADIEREMFAPTPDHWGDALDEVRYPVVMVDEEHSHTPEEIKALTKITPEEVKAQVADPLSMAKLWIPRYTKLLNDEIENFERYSAKTARHARP